MTGGVWGVGAQTSLIRGFVSWVLRDTEASARWVQRGELHGSLWTTRAKAGGGDECAAFGGWERTTDLVDGWGSKGRWMLCDGAGPLWVLRKFSFGGFGGSVKVVVVGVRPDRIYPAEFQVPPRPTESRVLGEPQKYALVMSGGDLEAQGYGGETLTPLPAQPPPQSNTWRRWDGSWACSRSPWRPDH